MEHLAGANINKIHISIRKNAASIITIFKTTNFDSSVDVAIFEKLSLQRVNEHHRKCNNEILDQKEFFK